VVDPWSQEPTVYVIKLQIFLSLSNMDTDRWSLWRHPVFTKADMKITDVGDGLHCRPYWDDWSLRLCSASQKFRLLWNPKFHYLFHSIPPLVPILSQMHPVHIFPIYVLNVQFNITFPSTPWSSEWSLTFRFSKVTLKPDYSKRPLGLFVDVPNANCTGETCKWPRGFW
jgi:hypothetical protein